MGKGAVGALAVLGLATGIFVREKKRIAADLENARAELAAREQEAQKSSTGSSIFNAVLNILGDLPRSSSGTVPTSSSSGGSIFAGILDAFTGGGGSPETLILAAAGGAGGGWGYRLKSDLMQTFGFASFQAAGIVGGLDHETDGFRALQEYNPVVAGSRGGYGIAQWTGERRTQFEAWARARGLALDSYAANWGFLRYELTETWERRAVPAVKATRTIEEATRVFTETYLRPGIPHMSSRIERAGVYA